MFNRAAALPKCSSSATVTKYCKCLSSILSLLKHLFVKHIKTTLNIYWKIYFVKCIVNHIMKIYFHKKFYLPKGVRGK